MDEIQPDKHKNWLIIVLLISCAIAIGVSFYFFYFQKDFDFIVEVPCEATQEECFQRDCSNPDDCPPNGLSDFKRYALKASDFKYCENENCAEVCATGKIKCEQITCAEDLEMGEVCVSPENPPAEDSEDNSLEE